MKKYSLCIIVFFLLSGCIGQKGEAVSGKYNYPDTNLSIIVPVNWIRTNILGNQHPILSTKIHYSIKPNIQLEYYSHADNYDQALDTYLAKKKNMYPDYTVVNESPFSTNADIFKCLKITAKRTNIDNTPVIHLSYIFRKHDLVFIFSATCAGPSLDEYEKNFDKIIMSVDIIQQGQV
jgi:hypothetical protein